MRMKPSSTETRYRLLNGGYALGLFLTFLLGASGDIYPNSPTNSAVLVGVPLGLTALLLCGHVAIAVRGEATAGRTQTKPSHAWVTFLLVYIVATWFAVQLGNLQFK